MLSKMRLEIGRGKGTETSYRATSQRHPKCQNPWGDPSQNRLASKLTIEDDAISKQGVKEGGQLERRQRQDATMPLIAP